MKNKVAMCLCVVYTKIVMFSEHLHSGRSRGLKLDGGAACATIFLFNAAGGAPIIFLLPPLRAAVCQMGAQGTAPLEGERNPAEGGCFASIQ